MIIRQFGHFTLFKHLNKKKEVGFISLKVVFVYKHWWEGKEHHHSKAESQRGEKVGETIRRTGVFFLVLETGNGAATIANGASEEFGHTQLQWEPSRGRYGRGDDEVGSVCIPC